MAPVWRRLRMDLLLVAVAVPALLLTLYFARRYGGVYRFGDSEYSRMELPDLIGMVIAGSVLLVSTGVLLLRRLAGGSITAQWRRERELLNAARREHERLKASRREGRPYTASWS